MREVVDPAVGVRDPHLRQQLDRPPPRLPLRELVVLVQLLLDLPADRVDRVQRGHRVLKDHRDLLAAHLPHRVAGKRHQVAALVEDLALVHDVRVGDQPHHRHHRHALSRPRLADDPDDLALRNRERDPVDGVHDPVFRAERDLQVADLEQRLGHGYVGRTRGSSHA